MNINNSDKGLFLLRLTIGIPMLLYGINKLFYGVDFIRQMLSDVGLPGIIAYGVYAGEVLAPLLLITGLRTRMAALVFATNCLTIILLSQTDKILALNQNGGWAMELTGMYLLISVALVFTGGGKIALSRNHTLD